MPLEIRVNPAIPSLNTREYLATCSAFSSIKRPIPPQDDCSFCFTGCNKDIPVFAYLVDDTDLYRNDFSSFITEVPTNSTVTGTLIYIDQITGNETEYVIVDDTYGKFYATDVLKTGVWGFKLDWYKVANLLGFGWFKFNLKITNTTPTVTSDVTTPCYRLLPWTCENAHGTVRIETMQSGYIVNGFDYRGIAIETLLSNGKVSIAPGWPQQLHWYGKFIATVPTLITDYIVGSNRDNEQVQSQIVDNYSLDLYHIQTNLSNHFIKDNLLANKVVIADYNRNSQEQFKEVRVNPIDISERKTFKLNKNEIWSISLEEFNKSTLKRN